MVGLAALAAVVALAGVATSHISTTKAAVCTPTGFFRDAINMTAAMINPPGTVSGNVDATGCNIGIYYSASSGNVKGANVFGANYFGVLVNGDVSVVNVDVTNSSIHDIGETPLNGSQHGVAIYYRALGVGAARGKIWNNQVARYQKNGITVNGPGIDVSIRENTVSGEGPIPYTAQNGIQAGYGANAHHAQYGNG